MQYKPEVIKKIMINLPSAFLERMKLMLGDEYEAFLASYETERSHGLRVNRLKAYSEKFAESAPFSLKKIPWALDGYKYSEEDRPGRHPYHDAGVYYIQEPSAMITVSLLAPKPGEKILDLCAAPGGKSTQAAALLSGDGLLVSNEINPARAKILSQNIERMGIRNAVVTNEDSGHLTKYFTDFFDGIIVDAPCSGEGMFRKDETAVSEWSPENVKNCAKRQQEILENAAMMLKPGGRLVYSTCTFAPEEDEQTIAAFLDKHPEFTIEETPYYSGLSHGNTNWCKEKCEGIEKTIRIWPHKTDGEGHYAALLRKSGEYEENSKRKYPVTLKDKKILSVYEDFCKEVLKEPSKWTKGEVMTLFGDQLYLTSTEMVDFKGLKVLRPGLQMGEFKKNRFEPSHALALALNPSDVNNYVDFSSDSAEIVSYLHGDTIQLSGDNTKKGWCLVTTDGYSIGWGKISSGVLKNHYPKGLRKRF